jgi:hypothetical protein
MMALIDFATVQVYCMDDIVEVVFPYDREFGDFLKSGLNGRWAGQRKCWQIKPGFAKMSIEQIVEKIEARLRETAPKKWDKIMEVLRNHGCVCTQFEVFVGLGGLRMKMPLGHPCHHYLKEVPHAENTRNQWQIPSKSFAEPVVQKSLARILDEDFKKYRGFLEPVEERCLIGRIAVPTEQEDAYGLKKGKLVAVQPSFLKLADPAMADTPVREIAFEVLKMERKGDKDLKVTLEYAEPEEGYNLVKARVYGANVSPALDHSLVIDDKWIQKRS